MAEDSAPSRRRSFGPVVLLGLATSGLAAVAAAKPWVGSGSASSDGAISALDAGTRYPLASAVSLVLLAAWGVLLVTRGAVRRVFAWIAAVSAVGLVAAVVAAYFTLPDTARDSYAQLMGRGGQEQGFTGWYWTTAACAVLALVPTFLAVRLVPSWPEMGSRYDAPGTREEATVEQPTREQDLWQALDEGRDPTDTKRP
jgi:uncharacterized membrane protein (TIGR02234 family)